MVMKATDDWLRCDAAYVLDGMMDWSVLCQETDGSSARYKEYFVRIRRKCASPGTTIWSTHSRRIDPISLRRSRSATGKFSAFFHVGL